MDLSLCVYCIPYTRTSEQTQLHTHKGMLLYVSAHVCTYAPVLGLSINLSFFLLYTSPTEDSGFCNSGCMNSRHKLCFFELLLLQGYPKP